MENKPIIDVVREKLGSMILDIAQPRKRRIYVVVDRKDIQEAARIIFREMKGRLCTTTGLETRDGIEIIYHLYLDKEQMCINLKVVAPKPDLITKSVGSVFKAAEWIERELMELYGVTFEGHPDPRKLLLADNWPEGLYPFRTDFPQKKVEGFVVQDVDDIHPDATHNF